MSSYMVEAQDDWNRVAADSSVSFSDKIIVAGDINASGTPTEDLDIYLEGGARMVAPSSAGNWYTIRYGRLTLLWDGDNNATIQTATRGDYVTEVALVGYPDDAEPYISTRSYGTVHFERMRRLAPLEAAKSPEHYTWVGDALARSGAPELSADLQSWDLLDALFPDNPLLWNAGKYLTRYGRKGDASKRVEDLRKAVTYLERAIKAEGRNAG